MLLSRMALQFGHSPKCFSAKLTERPLISKSGHCHLFICTASIQHYCDSGVAAAIVCV